MKEARKQDKERKAYLAVDRLHIGQSSYTVDTLSELPTSLSPQKVATPSQNQVTVFFNSSTPLWNFHPVTIKGPDSTLYKSSVQMYQHLKGLHYKDKETAAAILASTTTPQVLKLGKTIKCLDEADLYTEERAKGVLLDQIQPKWFTGTISDIYLENLDR